MATVVWTGDRDEAAGRVAPERNRELLQDDRIVNWGAVWLFLAAGAFGLYHAARRRHLFAGRRRVQP